MDQIDLEGIPEGRHHGLRLALAEESIVDKETRELIPYGLVEEDSHHRGVDAPGQRAQDAVGADPLPDGRDLGIDERGHRPVAGGSARRQEIAEHRLALSGMRDFGVELDAIQPAPGIGHGGHRAVVGGAERDEPRRRLHHRVAVAHPDPDTAFVLGLDAIEKAASAFESKVRRTVLAPLGRHHLTTQEIAHGLHAVADAEDGNPGFKQPPVGKRCARVVDAGWAAGEDDALVALGKDFLERLRARDDF